MKSVMPFALILAFVLTAFSGCTKADYPLADAVIDPSPSSEPTSPLDPYTSPAPSADINDFWGNICGIYLDQQWNEVFYQFDFDDTDRPAMVRGVFYGEYGEAGYATDLITADGSMYTATITVPEVREGESYYTDPHKEYTFNISLDTSDRSTGIITLQANSINSVISEDRLVLSYLAASLEEAYEKLYNSDETAGK